MIELRLDTRARLTPPPSVVDEHVFTRVARFLVATFAHALPTRWNEVCANRRSRQERTHCEQPTELSKILDHDSNHRSNHTRASPDFVPHATSDLACTVPTIWHMCATMFQAPPTSREREQIHGHSSQMILWHNSWTGAWQQHSGSAPLLSEEMQNAYTYQKVFRLADHGVRPGRCRRWM